ncbi:ABC transporter ATP-binding protein, partial [Spirochaetota bacterium]
YDYERMEVARHMSMVPQFFESIVSFTVGDFILTGRFPYKNFWDVNSAEDLAAVEEALKITDTEHLRDRTITELSGGELQLVAIARALVQNREVILLDEPLSSLDLSHSVQIMDILHRLNSEGSTILIVLHDINIASDYCSRIIALKEGNIFCDGNPEESIKEEIMNGLYNTNCSVKLNPVTGKPYVFPHPGYGV